jgi:cytosine/adenosine deaminase-related metal-dependent hydrolase
MILLNLQLQGREEHVHIELRGENIHAIHAATKAIFPGQPCMDFKGAMVFPGLINSHEHLEFNFFPKLGNRLYKNYREWADDIHRREEKLIESISNIPVETRTQWGICKNLLQGVTTVVNHGKHLDVGEAPINIIQSNHDLHSPAFEKNWKRKLLLPGNGRPLVMHLGEGVDEASQLEIMQVMRWNFFKKNMIAVHGVAMKPAQGNHFRALAWCPSSNLHMLGKTADISVLKKYLPILFGTDSTLSAELNLWDQLREARKTAMLSDEELFQSLTSTAASVWKLNSGKLEAGKLADMVIAKTRGEDWRWENFYALQPTDFLTVFHHGKPVLMDESLVDDYPVLHGLKPLGDTKKYLPAAFSEFLAKHRETAFNKILETVF